MWWCAVVAWSLVALAAMYGVYDNSRLYRETGLSTYRWNVLLASFATGLAVSMGVVVVATHWGV